MDIGSTVDVESRGLGVEYCTGYVDQKNVWREGFFCPGQPNDSRIYCCGIPNHKYCCANKGVENKNLHRTLVLVGSVTFIVAVLLTMLAFYCCKKYWKYSQRRDNLEVNQVNFYQMTCSSSNAPLVATSLNSFATNQSLNTSLEQQQPMPAALDNSLMMVGEAPPPYQSPVSTRSFTRKMSEYRFISPKYQMPPNQHLTFSSDLPRLES
ncbi:Protein shisa-9-like protein [Dinothrombium tinctorium]|uniref:Protein shisa-9-like protein n=1 Tax=Dinothrombium tinctorium TaxID=1965070 RepID=A0A443RJ87_9ACAR|nr:Protein shisa-9-like protein [Dinothrombium tinctorium]